MQNLPICILVIVLIFVAFMLAVRENFSTSGLSISNAYCDRIANTYFDPTMTGEEQRAKYTNMICGKDRRNTIAMKTGNYYTQQGVLI